jgi:3-oxoacyl-[acyl-carrier-protein] synthase II
LSRTRERRVVITGLGCISPVGNTIADAWSAIISGKSGIAAITKFDATAFSTRFAGEVKGFNIEDYIPAKEARHMDTFIHYGMAAGMQAMQDSGLEVTETNAERIGVIIGSGIGGLPLIEETHAELTSRGPRRISPFFIPASIINMISGNLSIKYGLKGPNLAIVTACTTGLHCIGAAGRMIQYGDADVMIAGGAESSVSPLGVGGFASAGGVVGGKGKDPPPPPPPKKIRNRRVHGTRIATVSYWARAPACWCSKNTNMPRRAAPRFTRNCSASA